MKRELDLILIFCAIFLGLSAFVLWLFREVIGQFLAQLGSLTISVLSIAALWLVVMAVFWLRARVLLWREQIEQARQETLTQAASRDVRAAEAAMSWAKVDLMRERIKSEGYVIERIKVNERLLIGNGDEFKVIDGHQQAKLLPAAEGGLPMISGEDQEAISYIQGREWIRDFLFDEYGKLKVFHVKTDGPTGVGKTRLMLHLMWLLQQPHPAAEFWLSDPKFEGDESGWPFQPFIMDFEDVAKGAQYLYDNVVTQRKLSKREGNPPKHPAFLLFDEADGCFDEHGDGFSKPVRRIIKEGRSGWTHCFVAGQSPLAKDAGFSGALFRNTARFVMGNEALAFLRNAQFSFWEKEHREKLKKQLMYLQEKGKRYSLVIPPSGQGLPFVAEIPRLDKPHFVNLAPPTEQTRSVLTVNGQTQLLNGHAPIDLTKPAANGKPTILEGTVSPPTPPEIDYGQRQFTADLQKVMENIDQIRYRKGRPIKASICRVLELPDGGREYSRAQAIAEHLEKNVQVE